MVKVTQVSGEARIWTHGSLILKLVFLSLYTTHMIIVENQMIFFVFFTEFLNHPQAY